MNRILVWSLALGTTFAQTAGAGTGILNHTDSSGNGDYLFWGQQITKSCGYKTTFQRDGNLVTYDGLGHAVWNTGTWNMGGGYAHVTFRGKLLVKNWADQALWSSPNAERSCDLSVPVRCTWAKLRQEDNGNLQVLWNDQTALWSSNRAGQIHHGNCSMVPETVTKVTHNQDLFGGDYKSVVISEPRPSWCGGYCALENGACKAYTYVPPGVHGPNAVCYLKNTVPSPVNTPGMVSGVVITRN
jgi:hypothetical protein